MAKRSVRLLCVPSAQFWKAYCALVSCSERETEGGTGNTNASVGFHAKGACPGHAKSIHICASEGYRKWLSPPSNPCSVVDSHPRRIVSLEESDSVASFIVEWSYYVISCVFCILIAVILTLGFVFSDYLTTAVSLFMAA